MGASSSFGLPIRHGELAPMGRSYRETPGTGARLNRAPAVPARSFASDHLWLAVVGDDPPALVDQFHELPAQSVAVAAFGITGGFGDIVPVPSIDMGAAAQQVGVGRYRA